MGIAWSKNYDGWWQEAPGIQGKKSRQFDPRRYAWAYVDPPQYTFEFVELPTSDEKQFLRFAKSNNVQNKFESEALLNYPAARYAVTWRGIRREHDREHLISGYEWIILDRETNEVLAVLCNYNKTGAAKNTPRGIFWMDAEECESIYTVIGKTSTIRAEEKDWSPRIVKTKA